MASQTETGKLNTSLKITNLLSFIEQMSDLWSHSKGIFQHLLKEIVDVNEANRRTMLTVIFSVKYLAHQCLTLRGDRDEVMETFSTLWN